MEALSHGFVNREQKKIDAGKGSKADFLQSEAQLLGGQARVISAQGALDIAKYNYYQLFGKQAPASASLQRGVMPTANLPTSLEVARDLALSNDPTLATLTAAEEAADKSVKAAKAAQYPRFDLSLSAEQRDDAQAVEGVVEESKILISMTYDIDIGLSKRHLAGAARATQQAALHQRVNQERLSLEAINTAWSRYETAVNNYRVAVKQVRSSTDFLELAKKERDLGKRSLQDILNGELVRLNSLTRQSEAETQLSISAFDILRATGQLTLQAI